MISMRNGRWAIHKRHLPEEGRGQAEADMAGEGIKQKRTSAFRLILSLTVGIYIPKLDSKTKSINVKLNCNSRV